jgi:hypothetical protein
MKYSDVVSKNLILPKKSLYTMKYCDKVLINSLFEKKTLTLSQVVFIVKCSAIYHDTDYSKSVRDYSYANGIYTWVSKTESA